MLGIQLLVACYGTHKFSLYLISRFNRLLLDTCNNHNVGDVCLPCTSALRLSFEFVDQMLSLGCNSLLNFITCHLQFHWIIIVAILSIYGMYEWVDPLYPLGQQDQVQIMHWVGLWPHKLALRP